MKWSNNPFRRSGNGACILRTCVRPGFTISYFSPAFSWYNTVVEKLEVLLENITNALPPFVNEPMFPLVAAAAAIVLVILLAIYYVLQAPARAERRIAYLVQELSEVTEKLSEAEKIGNFGSFTWDFDNPSASLWSPEMYHLCGLVERRNPPTIEALIETAHKEDRENVKEALERAQKQPGTFSFTFRSVAPSGQVRFLRVQGETTFSVDKQPRIIQGVAHDVTKEVEVDRAKTEFVSLASHQLKTPLTTIRWTIEALLNGTAGELSPEQTQNLDSMQEESKRMTDMVNDFLNVSRIELGTFAAREEEFDICELAQGVIDEQRHAAQEGRVTVKFLCAPTLPLVFEDKTLIRTVFQNLISNAIKYTPQGGSVECEISKGGVLKEAFHIRVSDTGIGIPRNEQGRVFEKLHRASNAQTFAPNGTGLGLYMVKTIIDKAGGNITFESHEGKGTTFYASLPFRKKPADGADVKK
jgi:signal transduction histidine kinase